MDKKSRELVMGKLYLKNKDYKMAEKSFLEYLNSSPEDFQALKMLAQVYEHLNDISKAFDLYERCYLAQPDRKGVLLDICRLLLMNDSHLDHVDSRKWLKLAIQAFPSNPIVTNLRDTLPINDYEPVPSKTTVGNEVIVDRLEKIEKAIEKILEKLEKPTFEPDTIKVQQMKAKEEHAAKQQELEKLRQAIEAKELRLLELQEKHKEDQNKIRALEERSREKEQAAEVAERKQEELIPMTRQSTESNDLKCEEKKKLEDNVVHTFGSWFMQKPATSAFGMSSDSGNPFADSLKKFNLPAEGLWTIPKKDEGKSESKQENEEKREDEGGDDGDNEVVENQELPIENFCDMQPIEIKSGEEDEDIVFEHRCKLFRFRDKEYKERGLGNIKVLKHRSTGAGRLIMRRELINLVCLNCWSCSKIERVRDTQVRFAGIDASDGDPEMTVFLAKFKTQELTDKFMGLITELFPEE